MILVIGYGNSLRGDDGAGLLLARQIEQACRQRGLPVERLEYQQLVPEIALDILRDDVTAVIFTDTHVAHAGPGTNGVQIRVLSAADVSPTVGHHLTPATLLMYTHLLYGKQIPARLVTVPGFVFAHGQAISSQTRSALKKAGPQISRLLDGLPQPEVAANCLTPT
ncbi:MAG: hydrogenase [Chloroflexi bacterium]|nr:MAG: hydrogenase [Chloroflexota bacterium]